MVTVTVTPNMSSRIEILALFDSLNALVSDAEFLGQLGIVRLDQDGAVRENYGWHDVPALVTCSTYTMAS